MRCKKSNMSKRAAVLLLSLALVVFATIGTTMAYLVGQTGPIVNTFTSANVDSEVNEKINTGVKNNVTIKNTGDVPAYIRAAVVVTWRNSNGEVMPASTDSYNITWTESGWIKGTDGFYYNETAVASKDETGELFTACEPVEGKAPAEGYELCVEILSEAIQAEPAGAVESAWTAVKVVDGNLQLK